MTKDGLPSKQNLERATQIAITGLHVCCESDLKFRNHVDIIAHALDSERERTLNLAADLVKTWHIKKGGYSELEFQIRNLKERE